MFGRRRRAMTNKRDVQFVMASAEVLRVCKLYLYVTGELPSEREIEEFIRFHLEERKEQ